MADQIHPAELQLNKGNSSDNDVNLSFLDSNLSICNAKIYDKWDDFDFDIVNFPFSYTTAPKQICIHNNKVCIFTIYTIYSIRFWQVRTVTWWTLCQQKKMLTRYTVGGDKIFVNIFSVQASFAYRLYILPHTLLSGSSLYLHIQHQPCMAETKNQPVPVDKSEQSM